MTVAKLEYCAQWLEQGLGIVSDGGAVLAKGLKAKSEQVMEYYLREELKELFEQELWV